MDDRKAILVVSFGTSYQDTREKTIGAVEREIQAAFPEHEFRRAYTSPTIRRILKERDGIAVDSVEEALERLAEEGYRSVIVQTTHVICGFEYERMAETTERFRDRFSELICGMPLLSSEQDYKDVVRALAEGLAEFRSPGTDIVLMGHGTEHAANESYYRLQQAFAEAGMEDFLVGTVEASPTLENMVKLVKQRGSRHVVLTPFMLVAGDHACNDMAGDDEDSWKSKFLRDGYRAECVLRGLGEYGAVRRIYVEHIRRAQEAYEARKASGMREAHEAQEAYGG